ncbi:MAG: hypothetical protein WCQ99_07110 [Pseudomonadota bacterium]
MAGIIELQQGFSQSSIIEKLQQVKHEDHAVYQQQAIVEIKEKNAQQQREVNNLNKSDDVTISEEGKRKKEDRKESKSQKKQQDASDDARATSEHVLDIIV